MNIYVRDLPVTDRQRWANKHGTHESAPVFLYCPACGARSSATRGDYFMLDPDTKLRCGEHRPLVDMLLMREVVDLIEVDPKDPFKGM